MLKKLSTFCVVIALTVSALCSTQQTSPTTNSKKTKALTRLTGPTVYLDYEDQQQKDNSVASFMYFVPMISTVLVESDSSPQNSQKVKMISSRRTSNDKEFKIVCEFEIWGCGYHENFFDFGDIIAKDQDSVPKGKPLKNIIEYIRFEGSGCGRIEVKGEKVNGTEKVTDVKVVFNNNDRTSPVTVGLYSVKPKDGQYKFENRYDIKTARVNTLTFEATKDDQRMDISLASLSDGCAIEGFYSRLKGKIANLFIEPVRVNPQGNKAMLDFGYALYRKQASFTFPKAKNLKTDHTSKKEEPVLAKADEKNKLKSINPD
jgi:hypothetical protein